MTASEEAAGAGGCDCHVHVFDPQRFPYRADRVYTPGQAPADRLLAHLDAIGLATAVLVQPSVYGSDHRCLVDALQALHGRGRGVAVLSPGMRAGEIEALDRAGVVAARVNAAVHRAQDPKAVLRLLREAAAQAPAGWHLQLHATLPAIAALAPSLGGLGRTVVIDHYGLLEAASGPHQAGWPELLALLRQEDVYLKLSAPYLVSQAAGFTDLSSFVTTLAGCAPQRLLWGSNWPHTQGTARTERAADVVEPFRAVDDVEVLRQLRLWLGDALYRQVMDVTPRTLFRFSGNRLDLSAS